MTTQQNYGLGFSPLSIKNAKSHGFVEEMVANKQVGMYGIITDSAKNVVSHEYLARTKNHLNSFVTRLLQDNTLGKLYKITLNDELVTIVNDGVTNLVEGSSIFVNNGNVRFYGVRFNFDADIFAPSTSALVHFNDVMVEITMTLKIGSMSKTLQITDPLLAINTTAYPIDYSGLEEETGDVILTIDNITIIPGSTYDYSKYKLALYDVLFVVV